MSRIARPNDNILFVPQVGKGSWLMWLPNMRRSLILSPTSGKVTIPILGEVSVRVPPQYAKKHWLRFWLNHRSDGTLSPDEPLLLDLSDPVAKEQPPGQDDLIRTLLTPIPFAMFRNPAEWRVTHASGTIVLTSQGGNRPLTEAPSQ